VNVNNADLMTLQEANAKMKKEVDMAKDEIKQLKDALTKTKQLLREKGKTGGGAATTSTAQPIESSNSIGEQKEEIEKLQKKVKELTETLANQNQVHATETAKLTGSLTALQKDSENTLSLLAQSKQQLELKDKLIKSLQETAAVNANNSNVNNISLRTRRKELIQAALKSPLTPEEEQYLLAIILLVLIILSILI
jgi:nitric oxide reductase activation protein